MTVPWCPKCGEYLCEQKKGITGVIRVELMCPICKDKLATKPND